jgi:hypothetical protein
LRAYNLKKDIEIETYYIFYAKGNETGSGNRTIGVAKPHIS